MEGWSPLLTRDLPHWQLDWLNQAVVGLELFCVIRDMHDCQATAA